MNILHYFIKVLLLFSTFLLTNATNAAEGLTVQDAWVRAPAPGASMLAGYATLYNSGDVPLTILAVDSVSFRMASLHETVIENGVTKMHDLQRLEIAPHATVALAPGGKHLMLMHPRTETAVKDKLEITFLLADGSHIAARFEVRAE